jgi:hypothetical protein
MGFNKLDPSELKRVRMIYKGAPITDINRLCELIDSQKVNGTRIFIREKPISLSAISSMSLYTLRQLLKGKALSEVVKVDTNRS